MSSELKEILESRVMEYLNNGDEYAEEILDIFKDAAEASLILNTKKMLDRIDELQRTPRLRGKLGGVRHIIIHKTLPTKQKSRVSRM